MYFGGKKLLIDNKANIEAKDKDGDSPLHETIYNNSIEVAKLLIEKLKVNTLNL